jgi:hypothetical protein
MARHSILAYPPQLITELALEAEPLEVVLQKYQITYDQFDVLQTNPQFRGELLEAQRDVLIGKDKFRNLARVLATAHLDTMDEMLLDSLTPPATKLGIFQAIAKLGDLEPKPTKEDNNNQPQFNLVINI